jgi:ABC-type amino acid transport substrate-binding protein
MRTSHALLIIILAVVCSITATRYFTGSQNQKTETAYERVIRTGTIRCGYAMSPPILVKDPNTGKISGLDVDVTEEIGKQLGLKIEWTEEVGWGNFIEGLNSGRYDVFCSQLWPETSRSKLLALAGPILYTFTNTYVRADDFRFDGDLSKINQPDIVIPVIDGDISYEMANRYPNAKKLSLTQMSTWADMKESVLTKKADILFFDQSIVRSLPEEQQKKLRKVEGVPHSFFFPSYYATKAGELQLRDIMNIAIKAMIDDGRLEAMALKYTPDYNVPNRGYTLKEEQK